MAFVKPKVHQIVPDIKNASIFLRSESKWGKALPVSELILAKDGWVPMGEIKVGDQVYGEDGKLHEVKGVYPQGVQDVYSVMFSDGSEVRCSLNHLWTVHDCDDEDESSLVTKELGEILKDYQSNNYHKYCLPSVKPMEFGGSNWGGSSCYGKILGYMMDKSRVEKLEDMISIPLPLDDIFKLSVQDRAEILAGMIYGYGLNCICKSNVQALKFDISWVATDTVTKIVEIAQSLGFIASIGFEPAGDASLIKEDFKNRKYKMVLTISGGDFNLLNLETPCDSFLTSKPEKDHQYINDIAFKYKEECQCIYVDNPSHLYITRNYIPTHNTTLFRDVILEKFGDPERGLLIKCGAESGDTMLDEINSVQIEKWADLVDLADWLIEERGKEHNIEIIAFDTVDELVKMAEVKAMDDSWAESKGKGGGKPKSINQAFGGFGKGPAYAVNQLITPLLSSLKKRFGLWGIAHTKTKINSNSVDSLNPELAVQQLTSNLDSRYEACFAGLLDIIVTGSFENDEIIASVKKGFGTSEKEVNLVDATKQKRKLYFRSTPFVDAGGRFADYSDIPESMELQLNKNNAKEFIQIVEHGMEKSKLKYRYHEGDKPSNPFAPAEEEPVPVEEPEAEPEQELPATDDLPFDEPEPEMTQEELFEEIRKLGKEKLKNASIKAKVAAVSGGKLTKNTPGEKLKEILEILK